MANIDIEIYINKIKEQNSPQSDFVRFIEANGTPFIVLVTCILSLRTKDITTYQATKRMLQLGSTPVQLAAVDTETLEKAIYPVGFYKNKARQIIEISKTLVEKYNSKVPNSIDELTKFNGVGRKTANLVVAKGFKEPAICVDVHVHRICNRWEYVQTKSPDETEMVLRKILPEKYWQDFNTLLVTHGQHVCKPVKPDCTNCKLNNLCAKKIL